MGFMDKAKKMAEQAQAKLDEAQGKFNANQAHPTNQAADSGPAVEYDKHGRPIESSAPPMATPGVPQTESASPAPPASTEPTPDPNAPGPATPAVPAASTPAPSPPAAAGPTPDPAAPDDRNRPSTEAPKMSHGDPLAG